MAISAEQFSLQGDKYLGRSYDEMDCQEFYERCAEDAGLKKDLKGSNAWYREFQKNGWVGTPESCRVQFGSVPKGATLFIHAYDGGEEKRGYHDGLGNASHIGIKTGRGKGAIHSSASRGCVAESEFHDKTIPNGGWNMVGLHPWFNYGEKIDRILAEIVAGDGGSPSGGEEEPIPMNETATVVLPAGAGGTTVNMRKKADQNAALVVRVPVGSSVIITEDLGKWCAITYDRYSGYMMSNYLEYDGQGGESGFAVTLTAEEYERVDRALLAIEEAVDAIGSIVGRG